jgi:hypothetical protein
MGKLHNLTYGTLVPRMVLPHMKSDPGFLARNYIISIRFERQKDACTNLLRFVPTGICGIP